MMEQKPFRRLGVAALLLLAGCASQPPAPVVDLSGGRAAPPPIATVAASPTSYTVHAGDTLYAISVLYNLDWRDLAQWNGIAAPYMLKPGMRLRLTVPAAPAASVAAVAEAATSAAAMHTVATPPLQVTTVTTPAQVTSSMSHASSSAVASPPAVAPPVAAITPAHTPVVAPVASSPAAPAAPSAGTSAAPSRSVASIAWRWPAQGKVVKSYQANDPMAQGIDIAGQRGAPVLAAADGTVVYSGNGLVGYGELIIVKHNDTFLSAYGHNAKRLVHEGDHVQAGQQIAEMGSSGTSQVELHFEIRKQGKPVDPTAFLPLH